MPATKDERTVHERMADALADLSYIPKERGKGVNYTFRGIDAVMNHLHPVLAKHGLTLSPKVWDDWRLETVAVKGNDGKDRTFTQAVFRVSVILRGRGGDELELGPGLAQSHDYGDKAVYQAQQNAIKYVLLEAFCIPTNADEDQDGDKTEAPPEAGRPPSRARGKAPAFDAKAFGAKAVEVFTEWDHDERAAYWMKAAKSLLEEGAIPTQKPANQAEGTLIVNRMIDYYVDECGHEFRGRKPKKEEPDGEE